MYRLVLHRFDPACRDGLTAERAALAVGASLHRWMERLEPKGRRPHWMKQTTWTPQLVRAVERLRPDFPMWGEPRLGRS